MAISMSDPHTEHGTGSDFETMNISQARELTEYSEFFLEDEMQIMEERSAPHTISKDILSEPIGILCRKPINKIDANRSIVEAVEILQEKHVGALVVMENDRLVGILTERDLLMKVLGHMDEYRDRPVREIMTRNPVTLMKTDSIVFVMNKMHVGGYRHIPITDEDGYPLHMISLRHVLNYFFECFPEEIDNLPPDPYRGPASRYGA